MHLVDWLGIAHLCPQRNTVDLRSAKQNNLVCVPSDSERTILAGGRMENVVYILGAGFSAPLGVPVMSNFLEKAKDQFANDPARFSHFERVFDTIEKLSYIKNYYQTDLFNIEDILSVLEMQDHLKGPSRRKMFVRFIRDVIEYHTPQNSSDAKGNPFGMICGYSGNWNVYGAFVAALLNLAYTVEQNRTPLGEATYQPATLTRQDAAYSVVSLNYDIILELAARRIQDVTGIAAAFVVAPTASAGFHATLCKLHGSVDGGELIPPTWSKHLKDKHLLAHWKEAHRVISEATQIRFVGYSLPVADAYVKYLLKSAVLGAKNLKQIDVLCRDGDGTVERRFRDFITFHKLRFAPKEIYSYLSDHFNKCEQQGPRLFWNLEMVHEAVFR